MESSSGEKTNHPLFKRWEVVIAFGIGILVLVINVWQIHLQTDALKAQTMALQAQVWQSINQQYFELSKVLIEKPRLLPYFNRGKAIFPKHKDFELVMAIADLHLDSIDSFGDEYVRTLPGMGEGEKYWVLWEKYFQDSFALSPALCLRYDEVGKWYGKEVSQYAKKGCPTTTSNPTH